MARICSVCTHPKRAEIDHALIENEAYRSIAKRFEASESAVFRHRQEHLPAALVKAKEAAGQVEAGTLFERLRALNQETQAILREARESGNNVIALQAIGRAEKQLDLEARLLGELDDRVNVTVGINVERTEREEQVVLFAEVFTPDELRAIEARFVEVQAKKAKNASVAVVAPKTLS